MLLVDMWTLLFTIQRLNFPYQQQYNTVCDAEPFRW